MKSRLPQWETSVNCSPRLLIPALKNRSFSHSEYADCPHTTVLSMCVALGGLQGWGRTDVLVSGHFLRPSRETHVGIYNQLMREWQ